MQKDEKSVIEPLDLWKRQNGADDGGVAKVEGSKVLQRVNIDFLTVLRRWPYSDRWKCISSAVFAASGIPIGFIAIGIALRRTMAFHVVRFQTIAVGYSSALVLIPASVLHYEFVMLPMATNRSKACPFCMEIRQVGFNLLLGCVIPAILLPVTFGFAMSNKDLIRKMSLSYYSKYLFTEMKPIFRREIPLAASVGLFTAATGVFFEHKYINKILDMLEFEPEIADEIYEADIMATEASYTNRIRVFFRNLKEKVLG